MLDLFIFECAASFFFARATEISTHRLLRGLAETLRVVAFQIVEGAAGLHFCEAHRDLNPQVASWPRKDEALRASTKA